MKHIPGILSIVILLVLFLIPLLYLAGHLSLPRTHNALLAATVAWFGLAIVVNIRFRNR